jgi:hypothetical protein
MNSAREGALKAMKRNTQMKLSKLDVILFGLNKYLKTLDISFENG